jgi:hypothetical protein
MLVEEGSRMIFWFISPSSLLLLLLFLSVLKG